MVLNFVKEKYIAILDSDDLARKNRITFQINRMKKEYKSLVNFFKLY